MMMKKLGRRSKLGKHLLADFFGVEALKLQNRQKLMEVLCCALRKGGFHIIRETGSHKFQSGGKGVTGFVLLAQSHAAFHSYPEYGYIALDIYSCGKYDPKLIVADMQKYLKPTKVRRFFCERGTYTSG